jgi:hypothetical protein
LKRHLQKRDYNVTINPNTLNFTHGVASVRIHGKEVKALLTSCIG